MQYNRGFRGFLNGERMRFLTMFAVLLSLSACAATLLGGGTAREPVTTQPRSSSQVANDSGISGSIRRRFTADSEIRRFSIGIRTTSGNVTLSGTVGSYEIRDKAARIAQETAGVRKVDSRLVVNTSL